MYIRSIEYKVKGSMTIQVFATDLTPTPDCFHEQRHAPGTFAGKLGPATRRLATSLCYQPRGSKAAALHLAIR